MLLSTTGKLGLVGPQCIVGGVVLPLTSDMADVGDDAHPLEVVICVGVHYQQPGLISSALDEGHHLAMAHALYVHPIHLDMIEKWRKEERNNATSNLVHTQSNDICNKTIPR